MRVRLAFCALLLALCVLPFTLAGGKPELPIKGLNGTGIGYCVTVEDQDGTVLGMVDVPFHVVNPEQRKKHGLPPLEMSEFDASIRNATALVVGAEKTTTPPKWVCATTYRDAAGNVLGCQGACGDCVKVRVKAIQ
jgi:hypothetical protein